MSAALDCFSRAIGLSQTACPCFLDGQPSDYDLSESGIFLDRIEGLELDLIKGSQNCAEGNIWDKMDNARSEGIDVFKTDLLNYIGTLTQNKRNYFKGVIGEHNYVRDIVNSNTYGGITWKHAIVRSGKMKIKRIGLIFAGNTTFPLHLYDNLNNAPLATWNVTPNANILTWFTPPSAVVLDTAYDVNANPQYWLLYEKALAPAAKDNKINCGCGSLGTVNIWNSTSYSNLNPPRAQYNWLDWIVIAGTKGNDLTKRDVTGWTHDQSMYGIIIEAEFVCNVGEVLCKDELDFINDPLSKVMAYTIRFKAAEILINKILSSGNLNRFTMLDREALYGKRAHYLKEYNQRIKYLGDELTSSQRLNLLSDCLSCYDKSGFQKTPIRVTY